MSKSKQNLTESEIRAIVRDEVGDGDDTPDTEPSSTRRNFVKGAGVAAALGLVGSGTAAGQAAEPGAACTWRGDQNAAGYSLYGITQIEFDDGTTFDETDIGSGGGGALSDSGTNNPDGGDRYELPTAEDSIDFQNSGEIEALGALNGGGPISDGDGTERQIWVIANGASDPAGAAPEDIIFEENA